MRIGVLLVLVVMTAACRPLRDAATAVSQHAETPAAPRQLGAWTGKGSTTLGFVSESGSFRINWTTRNPEGSLSNFQLTLRSGISGRTLKVITDHRGAGSGSVEFGDDPRMYEFLVDASGIEWSISVEETFAPQRRD